VCGTVVRSDAPRTHTLGRNCGISLDALRVASR
jgi:hypothetical protein